MRFLLIICFSLFVCICVNAQSDTLNRTGVDGKKYGYWIIYGRDKPESGFAPYTIIEEGAYLNGKKTGLWKRYHRPGILKSEIEFKNNRPNGKFITYYENGQMEEKGIWKGTGFIGENSKWFENGCLEYVILYSDAKRIENYIYYYKSDTCYLKEKEYNMDGKGTKLKFNRNADTIETILNYQMDYSYRDYLERPSTYESVNSTRKLLSLCECEVKVSDSIYIYWNEKYKVELKGEFRDNKIYKGNCTIFQDTVLVSNFKYIDGIFKSVHTKSFNPNGYNKTYNLNNQIDQDGEFKDGKMVNGKKYIYDKNGLLDKIEIYKNGKYVGDAQID